MHVSDQPAYILHSRPYRETSLLIDALSRDHGVVGLVARGVRTPRARWRGLLQPLQPLLLGWAGRGELATLSAADAGPPLPGLQGERLFAGLYVNELVLRLARRGENQPSTYDGYATCLSRLATAMAPTAWTLRRFERDFLDDLGYGLPLRHAADPRTIVEAGRVYGYDVESGPIVDAPRGHGLHIRGETLLALADDVEPDPQGLLELRRLMRLAISHHLGGAVLNAWQWRLR